MTLLHRIWSRLRFIVHRNRLDRDFDDELAVHLELLADDARRRGLSEADARREALRRLGQPALLREQHRDARGLPLVDVLVQDSRYAARMLRKTPVFTAVVTLTLALGIGANTALFSLVDNLLLRSLPVRDPDRLVQLQVFGFGGSPEGGRNDKPLLSHVDRAVFDALRAQDRVFGGVVGFRQTDRPTITVDGAVEPEREVEEISANFFTGLGVPPIIGRSPDASDGNVAVISARWWRDRFGGRGEVIGRALTIDGKSYTIIGVAPPRFHGFDVDRSADVWIAPATENLLMIARLRPGVTPAQAQAAVHPILRQAVPPPEQSEPMETEALPVGQGLSQLRNQYKGALLALMGLVTLVLLTTCTNVGHLIMLRNAARRRELTVRAALGAGRSRLAVQSLVESALLAAAGCVGGLLLARWGVSIIVSLLALPVPPDGLTFHADARVVGFAAVVSVLSVLLYGLGPAWRTTDVDLVGALRSGQGTTAPKRTRRLGRVLVACQVAFSVLLLVGAGLFIRTLQNLSHLDVGFRSDQLLQVSIDTRYAGYRANEVPALHRLLLERVGAVPGVRLTSSTRWPVMQGSSTSMGVPLRGLGPGLQKKMWDAMDVGPQFFETMGIELVRGRTFTAADFLRVPDIPAEWQQRPGDDERDPRADFWRKHGPFVINEAFARHFLPNVDPLAPTSPIVGVVKDVKLFGVKDDVGPVMFLVSRRPEAIGAVQVRAAGNPEALAAAIREAIQTVNPRLFTGLHTLGEGMRRGIAREMMVAAISGFFGVLGLSLACMGVFGVASNTVAQRTRELGIRRALGASHWSVIRESLRGTLAVVTLGLALGAIAAVAAVRLGASLVADLLYGLTATDRANLAASIGVMVVVALAACMLPAVRAARIDPLICLREE